ncbi:tRNA (guanosine(37)-N1)-methyltransferase TrmD [Magnetococcales bacterium HHB-1]
MKFSILTLFPEMFASPFDHSIIKRALERKQICIKFQDIRTFGVGPRRQVDDTPFGGGPGMVLKADVLDAALASTVKESGPGRVIYLSPQGSRFSQCDAKRLAERSHVILVCGHYEGVDERFIKASVDEELSLGDFVLTGGELVAMAVVDAVTRLLPGVLGDAASATQDSFMDGLLDYPHYTRPATLKTGLTVPDVLRSGHHEQINAWRRRQALMQTMIRRPDLIDLANLSRAEKRVVSALLETLLNA